MKIVAIKGGLGNQLFQYAYGKYLQKQGHEVSYNIDWFTKFAHLRTYLLPEVIKNPIPLTSQPATHDGYWQELKYTEPVKYDILNEISHDHEIEAIAMHVRRGDYVGHKMFINLGMDYYQSAWIEIVRQFGQMHLIIFSDDVDWCRENMPELPGASLFYPDDPVLSFQYMRRCKHKIIANSTFSWWAAYLSSGTTIAPLKWWIDAGRCYEENLLPKNWVLL